MDTEAEMKNANFEEKVKRTIYVDNLSPQVNKTVIKSAFDQYADVKNVEFIPNYTQPNYNSKYALVEFQSEKQAKVVLDVLSGCPFMMLGMPRPVRGRPAQPEMFSDRPVKPVRNIDLRWVDPSDPDFEVAQKLKRMTKKHAAERSLLLEKQLEEEEKLSNQQSKTLKEHYDKLNLMDALYTDGVSKRLGSRYGLNVTEDARTMDYY